MMRKIWDILKPYGIPFQASLERIMKCGIGICGTCMLGPFRICRDGPVLGSKDIQTLLSEFGVYTRKASGLKDPF
jgi:dihydroorotate dehydrogenase electron transfer subunit